MRAWLKCMSAHQWVLGSITEYMLGSWKQWVLIGQSMWLPAHHWVPNWLNVSISMSRSAWLNVRTSLHHNFWFVCKACNSVQLGRDRIVNSCMHLWYTHAHIIVLILCRSMQCWSLWCYRLLPTGQDNSGLNSLNREYKNQFLKYVVGILHQLLYTCIHSDCASLSDLAMHTHLLQQQTPCIHMQSNSCRVTVYVATAA